MKVPISYLFQKKQSSLLFSFSLTATAKGNSFFLTSFQAKATTLSRVDITGCTREARCKYKTCCIVFVVLNTQRYDCKYNQKLIYIYFLIIYMSSCMVLSFHSLVFLSSGTVHKASSSTSSYNLVAKSPHDTGLFNKTDRLVQIAKSNHHIMKSKDQILTLCHVALRLATSQQYRL